MSGGTGGSSGQTLITQTLAVTPGDILSITVGAGGQGLSAREGSNGTNSSIRYARSVITAIGGAGGAPSNSADSAGKLSGIAGGYGDGGNGATVDRGAGEPGAGGYVSITWG